MILPFRDHNPTQRVPYVNYGLILLNCLIFLGYWGDIDNARIINRFFYDWGLIPARLTADGIGIQVISSMFLHGGFMHLAGNMLFLHIYGDNLEEELGHLRYLGFYLISGIVAALSHVFLFPQSLSPLVGASGAVAGVMGGYLVLFPKARIDIFVFIIIFFRVFALRAWVVLGLWMVFQMYSGFGTLNQTAGVAYWAHIGGFVIGAVMILPIFFKRGGKGFWSQTHGTPPHPETHYKINTLNMPIVKRKRR